MTKKRAAADVVKKEMRRLAWLSGIALVLGIFLYVGASYGYNMYRDGAVDVQPWLIGIAGPLLLLIIVAVVLLIIISDATVRSNRKIDEAIVRETQQLRAANHRAKALQAMASTLRATLSFEPVVNSALDVCSLALQESGIPDRALVGAVFLYEGQELAAIASKRFAPSDLRHPVRDDVGILGEALRHAEPQITSNPAKDPGLKEIATMSRCEVAVAVPLRAGFQIFGAMLLGVKVKVNLSREQIDLFNSVADQAVIALQNAQLYQSLEAEKQRIVETEEEARKELARDLHDGPTQSVAAIVMRINFVSSLMRKDPRAALEELRRIETLAKETSKEIRGMLFTLRPLVLEADGLAAAIGKVMDRQHENSGIQFKLTGGEYGDLLSEKAQGIVFYIVEEALGNASKHSAASLIEVRMWREDGLFVLRIIDDGKGFDVRAVNENYSSRGSLGMVNMSERAELIDGTLKVDSAVGKGTTITLILPLEKAGRKEALIGTRG